MNRILTINHSFSLEKTIESGQCFRYWKNNNEYIIVAQNKLLNISQYNNSLYFKCFDEDFDFWKNYFDIFTNYDKLVNYLNLDKFSLEAYKFSKGIHILNQPNFETYISFIISQQNNIPRIKQILNNICFDIGTVLEKDIYGFPTIEQFYNNLSNLYKYKLGYREEYISLFIKKIKSDEDYMERIMNYNSNDIIQELKTNKGIGDKVANCIALFTYHKLDVFPIDVWIKKIIDKHYSGHFDKNILNPYAGLIQQYWFYYIRNNH